MTRRFTEGYIACPNLSKTRYIEKGDGFEKFAWFIGNSGCFRIDGDRDNRKFGRGAGLGKARALPKVKLFMVPCDAPIAPSAP